MVLSAVSESNFYSTLWVKRKRWASKEHATVIHASLLGLVLNPPTLVTVCQECIKKGSMINLKLQAVSMHASLLITVYSQLCSIQKVVCPFCIIIMISLFLCPLQDEGLFQWFPILPVLCELIPFYVCQFHHLTSPSTVLNYVSQLLLYIPLL